ncbi:putative sodium-dependent multivitamin transporter [Parasteatoda tepidariorum]|uniref:putative sodium-dependent multivitamin transporter n=1 Tax=Parasteatoda tepidariorum TaxID=114398 RepID=UPI00077FA901
MELRHYLSVADYAVIAVFLLFSVAIGIKFRLSGNRQQTVLEYLFAGKNMSTLPVVLSIIATLTATGTMISTPAEVYRYGIQHLITPFGTAFGMYLSSHLYVPVYFQCGVSTAYEFLEMRYGKNTRYAISAIFLIQTVLIVSSVLLGPALALSAVTNLSISTSIFLVGGVCTFYCTLGGLKAVLWTDVLQAMLMFTCVIAFFSAGLVDTGGVFKIYERAIEGKRMNLFNFRLDFMTRYTFWNCLFRGFVHGLGSYGTGQMEVQRMLSLKTSDKASRALQISILPILLLHVMCNSAGLILYSLFHFCDPILNTNQTKLTKYDQMVPYYIVNRFSSYPGLTGLCISGIFSGSLSTVSSALNSLSTVTVVDYIQPLFPGMTESKNVFLAKLLCFLYGIVGIGITYIFLNVQSLKQFVTSITVFEGSILAVFLIGILTRKADDNCIIFGTVLSVPIIAWLSFGALFSGYKEPPLALNNHLSAINSSSQMPNFTTRCIDESTNIQTTILLPTYKSDIFVLYKISFQWLPVLSFFCTSFMIFLMIIITGWNKNAINFNSKCLSPMTRFWIKEQKQTDESFLPANDIDLQKQIVSNPDHTTTLLPDTI